MFDLNIIEKDWLENCHALTEKEIIDIFREDGATIPQYDEKMDEWLKKTRVKFTSSTAEERLYLSIFNAWPDELREKWEREKRLLEMKLAKYPEPKKQKLSKENQKRVIEGSMNLVFEGVRYYHKIFQSKISEETLYYLLVESLIKVTRYLVHCGKPVFKLYVTSSFHRKVIEYISRIEKVPYEKARKIVDCYKAITLYTRTEFVSESSFRNCKEIVNQHSLISENKEETVRPSDLNFIMRNEILNEDLMENLNQNDFFKVYQYALKQLSDEERMVMQLSYDNNGYPGLTYNEISDFLGIEQKKVSNIKKRALKHIRQNKLLKEYKID